MEQLVSMHMFHVKHLFGSAQHHSALHKRLVPLFHVKLFSHSKLSLKTPFLFYVKQSLFGELFLRSVYLKQVSKIEVHPKTCKMLLFVSRETQIWQKFLSFLNFFFLCWGIKSDLIFSVFFYMLGIKSDLIFSVFFLA